MICSHPEYTSDPKTGSNWSCGHYAEIKDEIILKCLSCTYQARDEVIAVLESERTDSARLAAQYGFSGPENVLRALRRDSLRAQTFHLENVYKKPIAEVVKPYSETIRHHMALLMKLNELNVLLSNMSIS